VPRSGPYAKDGEPIGFRDKLDGRAACTGVRTDDACVRAVAPAFQADRGDLADVVQIAM
jgi:hypothetical protein